VAEVLALAPLFERFAARERKFAEVVVVVHHYGGNRHSFKRHIEWLNELGFDAVSFDLPYRTFSQMRQGLPISKEWRFGLLHVWSDKIESVLGNISENKFVLSFSLPSESALEAISRRHAVDIKGWICEGGPFLQLPRAGNNLFRYQIFKNKKGLLASDFIREAVVRLSGIALGVRTIAEDCRKYLLRLPKGFSVLSLRGERDILVAPNMIDDAFFQALNQIDLERVLFTKSEHLTAFRDEPEIYKKVVGNFLRFRATPLQKI